MVEGLIYASIALFLIAIIAHYIVFYKDKKLNKMSFRETFDLTNLPIATFYNGKHKLNFLLDSGSDMCHINSCLLDKLKTIPLEAKRNLTGIGNGSQECNLVNMDIIYHGVHFECNFLAADLTEPFNVLKKDTGVQLHGILGCEFFERYKYILDFKEMMFYSKK